MSFFFTKEEDGDLKRILFIEPININGIIVNGTNQFTTMTDELPVRGHNEIIRRSMETSIRSNAIYNPMLQVTDILGLPIMATNNLTRNPSPLQLKLLSQPP
jgi:hypothetical protein